MMLVGMLIRRLWGLEFMVLIVVVVEVTVATPQKGLEQLWDALGNIIRLKRAPTTDVLSIPTLHTDAAPPPL